jgi:hypothetical protein
MVVSCLEVLCLITKMSMFHVLTLSLTYLKLWYFNAHFALLNKKYTFLIILKHSHKLMVNIRSNLTFPFCKGNRNKQISPRELSSID